MTTNAYPRCTHSLRVKGFAYPRTCAECGLGPCKKEAESEKPEFDQKAETMRLRKMLLDLGVAAMHSPYRNCDKWDDPLAGMIEVYAAQAGPIEPKES